MRSAYLARDLKHARRVAIKVLNRRDGRISEVLGVVCRKGFAGPRPESGLVPAPNVARLFTLRVPTLVLIGDRDMTLGAEAADTFAHGIPNAKRVVILNAGHGAHLAQPASFNSALMDFFNDVERNKKK